MHCEKQYCESVFNDLITTSVHIPIFNLVNVKYVGVLWNDFVDTISISFLWLMNKALVIAW